MFKQLKMNLDVEPVITPPVVLTDLPTSDSWRILILSDLHIPYGPAQKQMLLADRSFLDEHDLVILLGDMTACYGTRGEYAGVRKFIQAMDRPYSVVNGNHEFHFAPIDDRADAYGKLFDAASPEIQRAQLKLFESFYRISSRFQMAQHPLANLCLLGIDSLGEGGGACLNPEHESWLEQSLAELEADPQPLLIFCHYPLMEPRLDHIRYYQPGRRPYYAPPSHIRQALAARSAATFWFSGHVHFAPGHPLWQPYQTKEGVWQIHCPDGWGFGRPDDDNWRPAHHDDLFVRSLVLEPHRLSVITTDVKRSRRISEQHFDISHSASATAPSRKTSPDAARTGYAMQSQCRTSTG